MVFWNSFNTCRSIKTENTMGIIEKFGVMDLVFLRGLQTQGWFKEKCVHFSSRGLKRAMPAAPGPKFVRMWNLLQNIKLLVLNTVFLVRTKCLHINTASFKQRHKKVQFEKAELALKTNEKKSHLQDEI